MQQQSQYSPEQLPPGLSPEILDISRENFNKIDLLTKQTVEIVMSKGGEVQGYHNPTHSGVAEHYASRVDTSTHTGMPEQALNQIDTTEAAPALETRSTTTGIPGRHESIVPDSKEVRDHTASRPSKNEVIAARNQVNEALSQRRHDA